MLLRFWPAHECKGSGGAGRDAQPAAQAAIYIENHFVVFEPQGFHLTALEASAAALTSIGISRSYER